MRFSVDPPTVSKQPLAKPDGRDHKRSYEDPRWREDPSNSAESSLLQDKSVSQNVTTFDVRRELREGTYRGEDGFIPNELAHLDASDDVNSSSEDELVPKRKRRRPSHDDDDDDDDDEDEENPNPVTLSDAIVAVVTVLKPAQTAASLETPEALVLANSNLAERDREYLLALVSKWSLRWGDASSKIHGPFTTSEMLTWARARYFSQPNRIGMVRPLGGCKWSRACDVFSPDQNQ